MRSTASSGHPRVGFLLVTLVALLASCRSAPSDAGAAQSRAEVLATLERYMEASRRVDADDIASFYASDGTLFEPGIQPVVGRETIRAFIESFPGVRVDVATATPDVVEVFDDTVIVWGTYHEELSFPGQPASAQDGRFVMEFVREGDRWLVQRLFRVPVETAISTDPAAAPK